MRPNGPLLLWSRDGRCRICNFPSPCPRHEHLQTSSGGQQAREASWLASGETAPSSHREPLREETIRQPTNTRKSIVAQIRRAEKKDEHMSSPVSRDSRRDMLKRRCNSTPTVRAVRCSSAPGREESQLAAFSDIQAKRFIDRSPVGHVQLPERQLRRGELSRLKLDHLELPAKLSEQNDRSFPELRSINDKAVLRHRSEARVIQNSSQAPVSSSLENSSRELIPRAHILNAVSNSFCHANLSVEGFSGTPSTVTASLVNEGSREQVGKSSPNIVLAERGASAQGAISTSSPTELDAAPNCETFCEQQRERNCSEQRISKGKRAPRHRSKARVLQDKSQAAASTSFERARSELSANTRASDALSKLPCNSTPSLECFCETSPTTTASSSSDNDAAKERASTLVTRQASDFELRQLCKARRRNVLVCHDDFANDATIANASMELGANPKCEEPTIQHSADLTRTLGSETRQQTLAPSLPFEEEAEARIVSRPGSAASIERGMELAIDSGSVLRTGGNETQQQLFASSLNFEEKLETQIVSRPGGAAAIECGSELSIEKNALSDEAGWSHCTICFNQFTLDDPSASQADAVGYGIKFNCSHAGAFHLSCLQQEAQQGRVFHCPLCRTKFGFSSFCICGSELLEMKASDPTLYGGGGVCCDHCTASVSPKHHVYHCPKGKTDVHPKGYDVCRVCAGKESILEPNEPDGVARPHPDFAAATRGLGDLMQLAEEIDALEDLMAGRLAAREGASGIGEFSAHRCPADHPFDRAVRVDHVCDMCGLLGTQVGCNSCDFDLCGACLQILNDTERAAIHSDS